MTRTTRPAAHRRRDRERITQRCPCHSQRQALAPERRSARAQRDDVLRIAIQRVWDTNVQVIAPVKKYSDAQPPHSSSHTRDTRGRSATSFDSVRADRHHRKRELVDFHDDPACRVLFATDAGGVGLNLQRAASACINIELPWNPAVLEQRIGRIHRLGQRRPIDVYNLVSEPGIESRIADLVGSKQALFTGLFDGTTDEVTFERGGGFLSRIERIVGPAMTPDPARPEDDRAERAIEAVMAAGDESRDGPGAAGPDPLPSHADIERLLSGLRVQSTASGGLVIEAPPDTASTLAALFAGMAQLLRAAAAPPATGGDSGGRP